MQYEYWTEKAKKVSRRTVCREIFHDEILLAPTEKNISEQKFADITKVLHLAPNIFQTGSNTID